MDLELNGVTPLDATRADIIRSLLTVGYSFFLDGPTGSLAAGADDVDRNGFRKT